MSSSIPIACNFSAIDDDERDEHNQNSKNVLKAVREVLELSNGYGFRLLADTNVINQAGSFISRERLCCPFFNFSLVVEPEQGPVWLSITGGSEVKQFIEQTIIPKLEPVQGQRR